MEQSPHISPTVEHDSLNEQVVDRSLRPLRLGEVLEFDVILESVSPRKKTGLGLGYFVTWVTNYTDQDGELVGLQRFTLFKFDPSTMGA